MKEKNIKTSEEFKEWFNEIEKDASLYKNIEYEEKVRGAFKDFFILSLLVTNFKMLMDISPYTTKEKENFVELLIASIKSECDLHISNMLKLDEVTNKDNTKKVFEQILQESIIEFRKLLKDTVNIEKFS